MKKLAITLAFITLLFKISYSQDIPLCNINTIRAHIGEVVYFTGKVSEVSRPYVKGEPTFMSIGQKYPNQDVTIVIWKKNHNKPLSFFEKFEGKNIKVKGKTYAYKGTPSIKIIDVDDIKIIKD